MFKKVLQQRWFRPLSSITPAAVVNFLGSPMLKRIGQQRWLWPAGIGLFLLIWLATSQSEQDRGSEPVWAEARQGDLLIDAIETGEVRALHSVDLAAPMEWRMDMQIISMVPEGSVVKEGDFLVQFDTSELQSRLELAQDALSSALAQRDKLRAEQTARISQLKADIAAAGYSQEVAVLQRELLKFEAATRVMDAELEEKKARIQLEEAATNLESQEVIDTSEMSTLRVEIEKARGDVRELEQKIANLTLKAPIGGLVVYNENGSGDDRKKIAIGDKPRPGQAVVSIPNLEQMQVNLRVNEMDAARLDTGHTATIILDAYPDKPFTGKVSQIAKLAQKEDYDSELRDFEVIVAIDGNDPVLKPGMTAKVQVALALEKDVLHIPAGALFERDGKTVVFPRKGFPKPVPVVPGQRNDVRIAVTARGLHGGELLSCTAPDTSYHRFGYTRFAANLAERPQRLADSFAEMEKRGLAYDYDGNRGRQVIARAPSGAAGDIEELRGSFPGMMRNGRPVEMDAASMKRLQEAMRGMQPGPGAAPGMRRGAAPGDTSAMQRGRMRFQRAQGDSAGGRSRMMRFERTPGDSPRPPMMMPPGGFPGRPPAGAAADSSRRRRFQPPPGEGGAGWPMAPGAAATDSSRRGGRPMRFERAPGDTSRTMRRSFRPQGDGAGARPPQP